MFLSPIGATADIMERFFNIWGMKTFDSVKNIIRDDITIQSTRIPRKVSMDY